MKALSSAFILFGVLLVVGVDSTEKTKATTYLQEQCNKHGPRPSTTITVESIVPTTVEVVTLETKSKEATTKRTTLPVTMPESEPVLENVCPGNNKYLTPQIIIPTDKFVMWMCAIPPSQIECNIKYMNQHNLIECYEAGQSTLIVDLPLDELFIGCVDDKSGIVRPLEWEMSEAVKKFGVYTSLPKIYSYEEGELMRVAHMFHYDQSMKTRPFCAQSRLLYRGVNITSKKLKNGSMIESATTCWCKGDMCAYHLFDDSGFNPQPYTNHEIKLNETLYTRKYVPTVSHLWEIIVVCEVFAVFLAFATHWCYKKGVEEANNRYGHFYTQVDSDTNCTTADTNVANWMKESELLPNRGDGCGGETGQRCAV